MGTKGETIYGSVMREDLIDDENDDSGQERHVRTVVLAVCACCGKRIAKAQGVRRLIFERGKTKDSVPLRRLLSVSSDGNYCDLKLLCPKRSNEIIKIRVRITMQEMAKLEQLGIERVSKFEMVNLRFVQQYKKGKHIILDNLPDHEFLISESFADSVEARMQQWFGL